MKGSGKGSRRKIGLSIPGEKLFILTSQIVLERDFTATAPLQNTLKTFL